MSTELEIYSPIITEAFSKTKTLTDQIVKETGFAGYYDNIHSAQIDLCLSLVVETLRKLRCDIGRSRAGQNLQRVQPTATGPKKQLEFCYSLLVDAGLIEINESGDEITRTSKSWDGLPAEDVLQDMLKKHVDFSSLNRLVYHAGTNLANIYLGRKDAVNTIFGSTESRRYLEDIYGLAHPSKAFHRMMEDFMTRFIECLAECNKSCQSHPLEKLHILEVGGGTGGTTKWLAPLLDRANVPVMYTFTDLSASFTRQASVNFSQYASFMTYRIQDIEASPSPELVNSQHCVIAVNAVHATSDMVKSLKNIRQFLRKDGFALVMEVQERLCWADFVFGLFEGWWLFSDGRQHATCDAEAWKDAFHEAGFGHVQWTGGNLKDSGLQRVFLAMADETKYAQ